MSFAAPLFLWVAAAVALATVAAHLLAWRRPPSSPLPTARFAPERPARVVSRAVRPTDLALLAMRAALVMLVGLALARPTVVRDKRGTARVVVADHSRSAGDRREVADSARAVLRSGDALVVFDSAAREVASPSADSLAALSTTAPRTVARGSVSAALIAAIRAGERLAKSHDSVAVVLVSPLSADEVDAATASIRRLWVGSVRVVRTALVPTDTAPETRPDVRASPGDPVAAALTLVGRVRGGETVRVVRGEITQGDSTWATNGGLLVAWPSSLTPEGWQRRPSADTAFAVTTTSGAPDYESGPTTATVVAPFARRLAPSAGRVVARWDDGEPAAVESPLGSGCVRSVAVAVPPIGDLPLTPAFRHFAQRMVAPCGDATRLVALSDSVVATLLPTSAPSEPDGERAPTQPRNDPSRLVAWLLGTALALAVAELFVRRGESHATA